MSNNEIGKIQGPVYSAILGTIAAGTSSTQVGTVNTPFSPQSRILGLQNRSGLPNPAGGNYPAGGNATPVIATVGTPVAGNVLTCPVVLRAQQEGGADVNTGTYAIYWYNESATGLVLC